VQRDLDHLAVVLTFLRWNLSRARLHGFLFADGAVATPRPRDVAFLQEQLADLAVDVAQPLLEALALLQGDAVPVGGGDGRQPERVPASEDEGRRRD